LLHNNFDEFISWQRGGGGKLHNERGRERSGLCALREMSKRIFVNISCSFASIRSKFGAAAEKVSPTKAN